MLATYLPVRNMLAVFDPMMFNKSKFSPYIEKMIKNIIEPLKKFFIPPGYVPGSSLIVNYMGKEVLQKD